MHFLELTKLIKILISLAITRINNTAFRTVVSGAEIRFTISTDRVMISVIFLSVSLLFINIIALSMTQLLGTVPTLCMLM